VPDSAEHAFASTTLGLEGALADELAVLGTILEREPGGVLLGGDRGLHEEICLRSRIANHVLVRLGAARGGDQRSLAKGLQSISVEHYASGHTARISVSGRNPRVRNAAGLAGEAWGLRSTEAGQRISLRLTEDACEVSVDASGEILHKRGYRKEISRAPLRETIAAGILRLADYLGTEPLWDPLCGSGTIAIEAALIALNKAPGANRAFAFMDWPAFDDGAWSRRIERAKRDERASAPPILGTDLNAGSLGVARRNARRAGVGSHLSLERQDALKMKPKPELHRGLFASNLPYGHRVEADEALYSGLGEALRGFPGWRFALLASNDSPIDQLRLPIARRLPLDNGGIPCTLLLGTLGE